MAKYESDFQSVDLFASTLFERGGASLTLLPGGERALIAGGDSGSTPTEVIVVGDGTGL